MVEFPSSNQEDVHEKLMFNTNTNYLVNKFGQCFDKLTLFEGKQLTRVMIHMYDQRLSENIRNFLTNPTNCRLYIYIDL